MPEKIIYYVQRYRPNYEAISKEARLLYRFFGKKNFTKLHNLHLSKLHRFSFNKRHTAFHFAFYPFLFLFTMISSRRYDIRHIFTNLGDLPYLTVIHKRPLIITGAASCGMKKIGKRRRLLGRVSKIIVETEMQSRQLKKIGIRSSKIRLIYPTVDEKFEYRPAKGNFKILYASCPTRVKDFDKRGINLLIDAAKDTTAVFCLAWRKKCFDQIKQMTRSISNIKLTNEISRSMNQKFADAHCTIIPYTKFDDYLKLIPNSAIESLAAKKPIIVSSKTEIAKIVEKEKCGEVFDPNKDSLLSAIERLKKGYNRYQKNCFKTFEKYFSQKKFLEAYTKVYQEFDKNVKV